MFFWTVIKDNNIALETTIEQNRREKGSRTYGLKTFCYGVLFLFFDSSEMFYAKLAQGKLNTTY